MNNDLISREALKEAFEEIYPLATNEMGGVVNKQIYDIIDNAPIVELKQLKEVRNICEHWNDTSSSFVSACNAFEDILHIFKLGVGDTKGAEE